MGRSKTWHRVRRGVLAAVASVAAGALAAGCGVVSALIPHKLQTPATMTLTSSAFSKDEQIPRQFTCHGAGLTPPLYWTGAPTASAAQATKSFAILVDDSSAPTTPYVYWIVFDIPAGTSSIAQDLLPPGALQGLNSRGGRGYDPLCPPPGGHWYRFTVYALNAWIPLPAGSPLKQVWQAIASHVIAIGRLDAPARP